MIVSFFHFKNAATFDNGTFTASHIPNGNINQEDLDEETHDSDEDDSNDSFGLSTFF